jgi:hypothetical protein
VQTGREVAHYQIQSTTKGPVITGQEEPMIKMTEIQDREPQPAPQARTGGPMTREQARAVLLAAMCADPDAVLDEAQRFPCRWAYSPGREAGVVYQMPGGTWDAADTREAEQAIRRARRQQGGS